MGLNFNRFGWALFTKASIMATVLGTYVYHTDFKKIDYNIFEKHQIIAEDFYKNPPILDVEWQTNNEGLVETYLVNKETGRKIEILYDMLPRNDTMIKAMKLRKINNYYEKETIEEISKQIQRKKPKQKTSLTTANMLEEMLGYFNNEQVKEK